MPVLPDQVGGEDGRTLTITLSEPGGRATLGSPAATELSIRDDDLGPPPPPQPFGLDPTYGTGGKASTTAFGGDRSSMALQPDGRVVMAGGTFTAFVLVRLLPDGQPDPDFGVGGQVVTDVGGQDNEAQNVVVLPDDGRIPVSGSSRNPGSSGVGIDHHTDLARYLADGQPDPSFGTGGTLTMDGFLGADPIVQPDGRLLLVGTADTAPPSAPPGGVTELSVMRLEPDGTPDQTFGDNGNGIVNVSVTALTSPTGAVARLCPQDTTSTGS